ncbi:hypothetical protein XMIN_2766 [Xanthomonas citri pv. mangiferaeindicae LMG 941]|nr:hypothetical protein XMIN_2766 [Xanthomonas citri pv. mangiferaeindicae LMG 941]
MSVPGWKPTTRAGLGRCACCTQTPGSGQLAVTIRPDQRRTRFPMRHPQRRPCERDQQCSTCVGKPTPARRLLRTHLLLRKWL